MRYTTKEDEITKFLVNRAATEQKLALDLLKVFNAGELHSKLNVAVWAAFSFLYGQWTKNDPHKDELTKRIVTGYNNPAGERVKGVEEEQKFLFPPGAKNIEELLKEFEKGTRYSAEQCASLIRLYGEVIDACKDMGVYWFEQRTKQIAWRYGGGGEVARVRLLEAKGKLNKDFGTTEAAKADIGSVWQKKEGTKLPSWNPKDPGGKNSLRIQSPSYKGPSGGRIRERESELHYFNGVPNPYYDLIPGNLFVNKDMADLHFGFNPKAAGVMKWKIQENSTIGRIDRTFGLPYGADISGTTTDDLYFLTGWADVSSGDPIMMMLPVAAIVSEYHHALLEVAAAMSLKKVISYSIGFYSTLVPELPKDKPPAPQRGEIEALIRDFDNKAENKHILLHYTSAGKFAGCFVMESASELEAFKNLATVDIRFWPKFNGFHAYPEEAEIMGLLNEVGLRDAALASRRGALRPVGGAEAMAREQQRLSRHV